MTKRLSGKTWFEAIGRSDKSRGVPRSRMADIDARHNKENEMGMNEIIREDMRHIRKMDVANLNVDEMADHRLLEYSNHAMREKLAIARAKGRGGWWDESECTIDELRTQLCEHVEKGDMRDVMNIAAMIYIREIADSAGNSEVR